MWKKRTNANGLAYSINNIYWTILDKLFDGKYIIEYAIGNCTIFCIGEQLENGRPMPVIRDTNANLWHTVVNYAEGWILLNYVDGMQLKAGDIVEWEENHVATIEEDGINPLISASWWTNYDGTSKGRRYNNPICSTLQEVSDYFTKNYAFRFYHSIKLSEENIKGGGGKSPKYVLRYNEIVKPTDRDETKNQLYVGDIVLNIRKEPTIQPNVLGLLNKPNAYFDVYEYQVREDYTWYNLGNCWVAGVEDTQFYKADEEDVGKKLKEINKLAKEIVELCQ